MFGGNIGAPKAHRSSYTRRRVLRLISSISLTLIFGLIHIYRFSNYTSFTTTDYNVEEEEDDYNEIFPPQLNATCRILIMKRLNDYHYEVFESIAIKYPLPFETYYHRCNNITYAGINKSNPIVVDYMLGFNYVKDNNLPEGYGWVKYFDKYLSGRIRRRNSTGVEKYNIVGDERWIQYGNIVDRPTNENRDIPWSSYSATIEVNCDWMAWKGWMKKDKNAHCIFHGIPKEVIPPDIESRVCWLTPYHHPKCWFIPSVLPKTSSRPSLSTKNNTINLCIGWKEDKNTGKVYRDPSIIAQALLKLKPNNVKVIVIGRGAKVPIQFVKAGLASYVQVENNATEFYTYQLLISQCTIIVPLMHPYEELSKGYFEGRLSGMISLAIGHRIPTLIHTAALDIYKNELTAFSISYNTTTNTDTSSFIEAFESTLAYYN